jgi:hypothetical protein
MWMSGDILYEMKDRTFRTKEYYISPLSIWKIPESNIHRSRQSVGLSAFYRVFTRFDISSTCRFRGGYVSRPHTTLLH